MDMKTHWNQYLNALGRTMTPMSSMSQSQQINTDVEKRYENMTLQWNGVSSTNAFNLKNGIFKEDAFTNELKHITGNRK